MSGGTVGELVKLHRELESAVCRIFIDRAIASGQSFDAGVMPSDKEMRVCRRVLLEAVALGQRTASEEVPRTDLKAEMSYRIDADKEGRRAVDRIRDEYGYDSLTFTEARSVWWSMRNALGF